MKFSKYNSIENSYRDKIIKDIYSGGFNSGEWEATLKIHGANLSVWYDGVDFKLAKRSGFIENGENFYAVNTIKDGLFNYVKGAYKQFNANSCVILYGELFGGNYPNYKSQTKAVQKGVYYSPDLQFYVFDIKVNGKYLDSLTFKQTCSVANIPTVPVLFRGSFRDCLNFNPVLEDPIYKDFNLPKVENNMAEGVVIKPCIPAFFDNGSRVILKNKNPKFAEKKTIKQNKDKTIIEPILTDEGKSQLNILMSFITENKLKNVLSKLGDVSQKDFGKIIKLFNEDIIEDYSKDNKDIYESLSKDEQKTLTKAMNKLSSDLLRKNFVNIIDGEF